MTLLARLGRLFPRNETIDTVETETEFRASPEDVWRSMLFYEDERELQNIGYSHERKRWLTVR